MKTKFSTVLAAVVLVVASTVCSYGEGWTTNFAKAMEQAKAEDKAVLLDFTRSDWCEWCMKMKKETLDTGAFREYASKNLVLVEVGFPQAKPQPASVKKQNLELQTKYGAEGIRLISY